MMISAMIYSTALLLVPLASGQSVPATLQEEVPPGRNDVICFAVAVHLGQAGGQDVKDAASLLAMYYFGRAQAQLPEAVLMDELRSVVPRIAGDRWEEEKARCAGGLVEAGELLSRSTDAVSAQLAQ